MKVKKMRRKEEMKRREKRRERKANKHIPTPFIVSVCVFWFHRLMSLSRFSIIISWNLAKSI